MIHSSWVWLACVLRTRPGIATFSDAIAAATAPRAMQTTAVTIVVLAGLAAAGADLAGHGSSPYNEGIFVFI